MITRLVLLFSLLLNYSIFAAQRAEISVHKAVVYSDTSLDVPLGYLPKGKEVIVGSVMKRHNKIIAVLLEGKVVGWIQVQDIRLLDRK